jgi:hypothetical protein
VPHEHGNISSLMETASKKASIVQKSGRRKKSYSQPTNTTRGEGKEKKARKGKKKYDRVGSTGKHAC